MTDAAEVVDAEIVHDHPDPAPGVALELAPRQRRSEVIRPLNADELTESFKQYQELLPRLLDASDYQEAGRGKRFVKKSGWRKIATAFDLDVQIIRSHVERNEHGEPQRAEVWARAIAPSGRAMDGDGYCSVDEDRFSGPRGNKSKLENDLRATATTRAMNRAISGLVGMGEVSAEEVTDTDSHTAPQIISEAEAKLLGDALLELTGAPDKASLTNLWTYIRGELQRPGVTVARVIHAIHAQQAAFAEAKVSAVQEAFDATEETPA